MPHFSTTFVVDALLLPQALGLNSEVAVVFNVEERKAVITGTW